MFKQERNRQSLPSVLALSRLTMRTVIDLYNDQSATTTPVWQQQDSACQFGIQCKAPAYITIHARAAT